MSPELAVRSPGVAGGASAGAGSDGLRMGRSRLAWAGSTVAPWGIALGLLVSITAQADQEPGLGASRIARGPLGLAAFQDASDDDAPVATPAHLILGSPGDLSAASDDIEPNPALKRHSAAMPNIDRSHKGDPIVALRPGFDARARVVPIAASEADVARLEANWPSDSRSPAGPQIVAAPSPAAPDFGDGATPPAPLEFALNSASPRPSDTLLIVKAADVAAQTTAVASSNSPGAKLYASLIDPKDSVRQMRCLAEAVYFESRSEPEAGQAAVAQVVLNRVRSGIFPTDVCGVVYQDANRPFACQFSFACEGKSLRIEEPAAWAAATRIASEVASGANFNPRLAEALNYHAAYVYPFWAPTLRRVDKIGMHIFYSMRVGLNWAPGALNGRGDLPPLQQAQAAVPVGLAR